MVFGSKSSSSAAAMSRGSGNKLFEQPLEKLFNPKAIKQFNETIAASNSRSPPALCQSLSAPLTSTTLTWAKLSRENSASKRKRAAARLRRFTIDANNNNNNNSLITTITSGPLAHLSPAPSTGGSECDHNNLQLCHERLVGDPSEAAAAAAAAQHNRSANHDHEQCRQLLLNVLPEPIRCLLNEIYLRGPSTVGIFRKSPNAKHCRELKQKLEAIASQPPVASAAATTSSPSTTSSSSQAGQKPPEPSECQSSIEQFQVNVIASVFKEWLRSLPDCLLMSRLYPQWIDVAKLIEPLHQYKLQLEQQQQSSDPSGNSNKPATSPMTARRQQQQQRVCSNSDEPRHGQQRSLSRALSCSVMTTQGGGGGGDQPSAAAPVSSSDSGRSSSSPSPNSPTNSNASCTFDATCGREPGTGSPTTIGGQFTPVRQNRQHSTPRAAYLKRKCYEQQQQQHRERSQSEFATSLQSGAVATATTTTTSQPELSNATILAHAPSATPPMSTVRSQEFCMRERRLECLRVVRQLLETLNEANLILLRAIICVLWHIAESSELNKMSSNNLGVCIGQSLLTDEHQQQQQHRHEAQHGSGSGNHSTSRLHTFSLNTSATGAGGYNSNSKESSSPFAHFTKRHRRARSHGLLLAASTMSLTNLSHSSSLVGSPTTPGPTLTGSLSSNYLDTSGAQEAAKYVPILVAFMIDNARELFGSDVMHLFGPAQPVRVASDAPEPVAQQQQVQVAGDGAGSKFDQQPPAAASTSESHEDENTTNSQKMEKIMPAGDKDVAAAVGPNPRMSSPVRQHRRQLSTSVLVHIGSSSAMTTGDDQVTESSGATKTSQIVAHGPATTTTTTSTQKRRAPQPPSSSSSGDATTSILIVNAPKSQTTRQLELGGGQEATSGHEAQVKPDSSSGHNVDTPCPGDQSSRARNDSNNQRRNGQQQRPLSASESIGSSSRASSSTSGVHSAESPAFSCGGELADSSCSASGSSASSTSSRNCRTRATTTCSSGTSSRSASISSPVGSSSAPSVCTSPMEVDLNEMVSSSSSSVPSPPAVGGDPEANSAGAKIGSSPELAIPEVLRHLSHNEAMRHNLLGVILDQSSVVGRADQVDSAPAARQQAHTMISRTKFERPKSMVSLGELAQRRQQMFGAGQTTTTSQVTQQQQQQVAAHRPTTLMMTAPATIRSRAHGDDHLCRRTSYDAQLVASSAAANNHRAQMNNNKSLDYRSQTLGRFPSRTTTRSATQLPGLVCPERMPKIPFQYTTSSYGGEAVLYYPAANYAAMQQQHSFRQQQQQHFQHQMPQPAPAQRSHVMMLRDYYLSLQEQSQKQQQYRDFLRRQQREQQAKEQMQLVGSQPASLTRHGHHQHQSISQQQPSSLMVQQQQVSEQQQQPAAVAYQRIQPRMARIRQNQLNGAQLGASGLYVKQATNTTTCSGGGGSANAVSGPTSLLVLDNGRQASERELKRHHQGVSSSASSTEHSPSEEDDDDDSSGSSDECGSAGQWMESTMV